MQELTSGQIDIGGTLDELEAIVKQAYEDFTR